MKLRHKNKHQENFPVGMMMFNKDIRKIVADYYRFARYADDIADNPHLKPQNKVDKLYELEEIFTGQKSYKGQKLKFVQILKDEFAKHNLSPDLATDLLIAFRKDSLGFDYQTWGQLVDYCKYSAAPVGRFMLAIHDESAAAYLPAETLCAVLQITNHLQDMKADACHLKRCYLPTQMMNEYGVEFTDICLTKATPALQALIKDITTRLKAMLKDAKILFSLVRNRRLKAELGVIFSLTNSMLKKIEKGDVIASSPKLNLFDWQKAFWSGIRQGLFTRMKLCRTNNKIK